LPLIEFLQNLVPWAITVVLPLGVAGQHIGLGVATASCLFLIYKDRGSCLRQALKNKLLREFFLIWLLIMAPILIATLSHGRTKDGISFFWGYLYAGFIPLMGAMMAKAHLKVAFHSRMLLGVMLLCAGVALSQVLLGWKLESTDLVGGIKRAQGFYSHPLTFAYVVLLIMPWSFFRFIASPKSLSYFFSAASVGVMLFTSQSITVLTMAALTFFGGVFFLAQKKPRIIFCLVALMAIITAVTTHNPIHEKLNRVLSGDRGDRETPYYDDRMAFWHAHWEMFKDAPLLGHGSGLEAEDRAPYYEKIGLPDIERKYEAHNMYLQYAVEGGVIPALTLVLLLVWLTKIGWNAQGFAAWARASYIVTPIAFATAGLTQNAVQDSEVRFALLCYIGFLFWRLMTNPQARLNS